MPKKNPEPQTKSTFYFPELGVSVEAVTLDEAVKLAEKQNG